METLIIAILFVAFCTLIGLVTTWIVEGVGNHYVPHTCRRSCYHSHENETT